MYIFPAIDLRGGRCVRLLQGRADAETAYFDDPAEAARLWKEGGAEWIHVVDLDGAFEGAPRNWESIEKIAAAGTKLQMGGGIRSEETIERALSAGVNRVILGTIAFENEEFIHRVVDRFGDKIAVGIDAKGGKVAIKGWVDTTELTALDLAKRVTDAGVQTIIYTDISTDGMLTGPNIAAQKEMLETVQCNVIASGGVSSRDDIIALKELEKTHPNLLGVIVGVALYERKVDLADLVEIAGG